MSGQNLILIRDSDCPSDAALEQAQRLLSETESGQRTKLRTLSVAEVIEQPGAVDAAHVAWILAERSTAGELLEVIAILQDRHIAVLLTHGAERVDLGSLQQDGVMLCSASSEPRVVDGILRALRSQAPVLRAMETELRLLRAHQGGLADQIGRIDEELRLAAQLQREFLPKSLASIGDVGFRVLFRPAGYVSGDIYDVIRLDERHIGFFIADAVGHGVPAALLTMYIKRSLVTKRIDPASRGGYRLTQPAEALAKLNRDLIEQQSGHVRFATACYGVIDCDSLEVCIARAGHPFPIVLRTDGQTQTLEPEGGLLGVFPDEEYQQVCLTLGVGDRLLLYSDGFETAFPADGQAADRAPAQRRKLATQQYVEEFEDLREGSVDDALLRLQDKLDAAAGSLNQRDDLTLMCLCVDGAPRLGRRAIEQPVSLTAD